YKKGSDPDIDEAIRYHAQLEDFLGQGKSERAELASGYARLAEILGAPRPPGQPAAGAVQGAVEPRARTGEAAAGAPGAEASRP
ncbi:MAG: flagellum-specific ATP synthase FliI, partial [Kiloniellaceae bacterium]